MIVFERKDWKIFTKGIPGVAGVTDTMEHVLTYSGEEDLGDYMPSVSPNGQWVAFARRDNKDPTIPAHIWRIPIGGGTAVQLTSGSDRIDNYPRWSPDGDWIYFQRNSATDPSHAAYRVKFDGSVLQLVYNHPNAAINVANPAPSPDGKILTVAIGTRDNAVRDTRTHTLDPALSATAHQPVVSYADTQYSVASTDPTLSPVLSTDGTRLQLGSKQLYAVRRNMSLPPKLTQIGVQSLHDTTARVFIDVIQNLASTTQLSATDPEGDTLTYHAYFLANGMTFNPATRTLSWTPTAPIGSQFYVKFDVTTRSGGTDQVIAIYTVVSSLYRPGASVAASAGAPQPLGPNPTSGAFAISTPKIVGAMARLEVYDASGRRVRKLQGRSGEPLVWDGRDEGGRALAPAVYVYIVEVGGQWRRGRVVVLK